MTGSAIKHFNELGYFKIQKLHIKAFWSYIYIIFYFAYFSESYLNIVFELYTLLTPCLLFLNCWWWLTKSFLKWSGIYCFLVILLKSRVWGKHCSSCSSLVRGLEEAGIRGVESETGKGTRQRDLLCSELQGCGSSRIC